MNASFSVRGSVEQIDVWKAPPGAMIEVRDGSGAMVQSGTSDMLGSLVFRDVPPGSGYAVSVPSLAAPNEVSPVVVMSVAGSQPPQSFYTGQQLAAGYTYITTRDGTKLSAFITLPGPPEKGPYPTVVNYSGYNPSQPGAPLAGDSALCPTFPVLCDAPTDPSALVAALMGYATVGVNVRGTGCSGGAYDYFEELQLLDGYDVIETVAAQSWVVGHRVGMSGLSYPAIAELFVAQTQPPSLAAITPLSVIGNTATTMRPGGILNDGFALSWATSVLDKAGPYGQGWEKALVDAGDTVCGDNQLLHGQAVNIVQQAQAEVLDTGPLAAPLDPTAFAPRINVPVFLASAFEDEQTGPFFFTLLDQFKASPLTRFSVYNGVHIDSFAPQILVEWKAFLDIYVAHVVPMVSADVRSIAAPLFQSIFQVPISFPPDRFAGNATWEEAKAAYEAEQPLRVLFENGGGTASPGAPEATFEMHFDAWPPGPVAPLRLYFQGMDRSSPRRPPPPRGGRRSSSIRPPATAASSPPAATCGTRSPTTPGRPPLVAGAAVVMETPPLTADLVMAGTASVDLWVRSPVDDADLQVSLIEVRPDGQERYVQSGWLRASLRELASTATDPWPAHTYATETLLVPGAWTAARIGVPGFAHVFRAGSQIRVLLDTPGGSRAAWTFALKTFPGTVSYDIASLGGLSLQRPLARAPRRRVDDAAPAVPVVARPAVPGSRALHQHGVHAVSVSWREARRAAARGRALSIPGGAL